jgi:hypothetical protein
MLLQSLDYRKENGKYHKVAAFDKNGNKWKALNHSSADDAWIGLAYCPDHVFSRVYLGQSGKGTKLL